MDTVRRMQDHDFTAVSAIASSACARATAAIRRMVRRSPPRRSSDNNSSVARAAGVRECAAAVERVPLRRATWNSPASSSPCCAVGISSRKTRRTACSRDRLAALHRRRQRPHGAADSFAKSAPVHGRNPGWLGNLLANHKRWAVNARVSYTGGHNDFALGESASGLGPLRRRRPTARSW